MNWNNTNLSNYGLVVFSDCLAWSRFKRLRKWTWVHVLMLKMPLGWPSSHISVNYHPRKGICIEQTTHLTLDWLNECKKNKKVHLECAFLIHRACINLGGRDFAIKPRGWALSDHRLPFLTCASIISNLFNEKYGKKLRTWRPLKLYKKLNQLAKANPDIIRLDHALAPDSEE